VNSKIKNWFSNFIPLDKPFEHEGIKYNTVEAFFQAQKSLDPQIRAKVAQMDPSTAKRFCGRKAANFKLRPNWDNLRNDIMEIGLRAKFVPGTNHHKKLMETEGEIIEWNNWGDTYWGKDIRTGKGRNFLGLLLMKLRDEYKNRENE